MGKGRVGYICSC